MPVIDDIDLGANEFWSIDEAERHELLRRFRETEPFPFFAEPRNPIGPDGPGFFVATRYADVVDASRQPELFCSGKGATSALDQGEEFNEFFGSMINMDDPRHKRLRGLVSAGFTPRQLERAMEAVERIGANLAEGLRDREGEFDFVADFAAPLPLEIICDMMGIPESQYGFVLEKSNCILGATDPEYKPEGLDFFGALMSAALDLSDLMKELAEARRRRPTDDLISTLMSAEIDGERLTEQELASFFIMLTVAGNETTRNAISWGLHFLTDNLDQRAIWESDFDAVAPTAVEEIVRLGTPVISMRRTVTTDGAVLGGRSFEEGDKILLNYWSANRDESVFDDPLRFDVRRDPNYHVSFGAPGPHFCMGAHLTRREIAVAFRELFSRVPGIRAVGPPELLSSSFINGIKRLPAEV